ncbi:alpha/beta hydrolase [uncultured Thiocystis sp.]|jgi:pimeloyl-ACP methyl ester carboxylesterase|uniref:esterase/lipase family protein n=1 Tax=uncultured Thiocystis sp. TaxID=1202134 RepID=UPI0025F02391|nr:alpha/beta hydrolase [uncultured Thiocystis sp.]
MSSPTNSGFLQPLVSAVLSGFVLVGCQSVPAPPAPPDSSLATQLDASLRILAAPGSRESERDGALADSRRLTADRLPDLLEDATKSALIPAGPERSGVHAPADFANLAPVPTSRVTTPGLHRVGIGLPMVGALPPADANAPRAGYRVPLTLLALPKSNPSECCDAALVDPDRVRSVRTVHGEFAIAMDLEAPIDAIRATGPSPVAGLLKLIRPGRFSGTPRVVFLQPFAPDKIPVVLVHGLMSTPLMWAPLVKALLADERIRTHFQFWFFFYPTGQPVPLSALQLREALDAVARDHGPHKPMVLIGHSMGGILSRAQVSRMSAREAETIRSGVASLPETSLVRRALIFDPRRDVSRAVFMFTPHRGSRLAANNLGAWGIRLIRLPDWLLGTMMHYALLIPGIAEERPPTSIHGLSPNSSFLRALDRTQPTVPTHTILGDRGRRRGSLLASSDGVVAYSSAHLAAAKSEVVVPAGHGGFDHPLAIAELRRILHQELAETSGPGKSASMTSNSMPGKHRDAANKRK